MEDGRQLRILVVIDEFTRECLAIEVARSFTARAVSMTRRTSSPCVVRRNICGATPARSLSPRRSRIDWEKIAYAHHPSRRQVPGRTATSRASLVRLRDELLDRELFSSLTEARVVLDQWQKRLQPQAATRRPELDDAGGLRRWP